MALLVVIDVEKNKMVINTNHIVQVIEDREYIEVTLSNGTDVVLKRTIEEFLYMVDAVGGGAQ